MSKDTAAVVARARAAIARHGVAITHGRTVLAAGTRVIVTTEEYEHGPHGILPGMAGTVVEMSSGNTLNDSNDPLEAKVRFADGSYAWMWPHELEVLP